MQTVQKNGSVTFSYMHLPTFVHTPRSHLITKSKCLNLVTFLQMFKSLERLVPVPMDFYSWHCLSTDTEGSWLHEGRHAVHCVSKKVPGMTVNLSFHWQFNQVCCIGIKKTATLPISFMPLYRSCSGPFPCPTILSLCFLGPAVHTSWWTGDPPVILLCSWINFSRGLWLRND